MYNQTLTYKLIFDCTYMYIYTCIYMYIYIYIYIYIEYNTTSGYKWTYIYNKYIYCYSYLCIHLILKIQ